MSIATFTSIGMSTFTGRPPTAPATGLATAAIGPAEAVIALAAADTAPAVAVIAAAVATAEAEVIGAAAATVADR
jgi:hypothetical protein